jgi:hypothetical protein
MDGVIRADWREAVADEHGRIERLPYELCVLIVLRDAIRRRELYVEGALGWSNPGGTRRGCPSCRAFDRSKFSTADAGRVSHHADGPPFGR